MLTRPACIPIGNTILTNIKWCDTMRSVHSCCSLWQTQSDKVEPRESCNITAVKHCSNPANHPNTECKIPVNRFFPWTRLPQVRNLLKRWRNAARALFFLRQASGSRRSAHMRRRAERWPARVRGGGFPGSCSSARGRLRREDGTAHTKTVLHHS